MLSPPSPGSGSPGARLSGSVGGGCLCAAPCAALGWSALGASGPLAFLPVAPLSGGVACGGASLPPLFGVDTQVSCRVPWPLICGHGGSRFGTLPETQVCLSKKAIGSRPLPTRPARSCFLLGSGAVVTRLPLLLAQLPKSRFLQCISTDDDARPTNHHTTGCVGSSSH